MLSRGGQQFGGSRGGGGGGGVSAAAWGSLATPQPRPSWWQGLSPRTKQSLLALFALVFVFALYRLLIVPPSAAFNPSSAPPRHHVKQKVLLTGGAGFIGSHTALALLSRGDDVIIVDEVNNYYDVSQKEANLRLLQEFVQQKEEEALRRPQETGAAGARTKNLAKTPAAVVPPPRLRIHRFDICDREAIAGVFAEEANSGFPITHICHLAARAGVRPSIEDPDIYVHSNVQGTLVMLDMARDWNVTNFVYASSSSVYGGNTKVPFAEEDPVDNPVSPYAATKKATELIASTYNHLYGIPMAGLRFFTVYGPRGRPDMAPFIFLDRVYRGEKIHRFGDGTTARDYTYIDDIVQGILASLDRPFKKMEVFNLGNSQTVQLKRLIEVVEEVTGKKALIEEKPLQPGDVPLTFADLQKSRRLLDYSPSTDIEEGMRKTFQWYLSTRGHKNKK